MKRLGLAAISAVVLLGSGCAARSGQPQIGSSRAFKGYELYTWAAAGEWRFAMLLGTNREKSWSEVEAAAVSEAELRRALRDLGRSEWVSWCNSRLRQAPIDLEMPPTAKVNALVSFARERELNLQICE